MFTKFFERISVSVQCASTRQLYWGVQQSGGVVVELDYLSQQIGELEQFPVDVRQDVQLVPPGLNREYWLVKWESAEGEVQGLRLADSELQHASQRAFQM